MKEKYGFHIGQITEHVLKTQKCIRNRRHYQLKKSIFDPDMNLSQEKHIWNQHSSFIS
jgi:hypothetical protein